MGKLFVTLFAFLPAGRQGLHRDNLVAKEPGRGRCLRRVPQPPHIAGPLCVMCANTCIFT
jgi:hypothetical protein